MAHYPRRVKDLPHLELDSEEEPNTPCKIPPANDALNRKSELFNQTNKENECINNMSVSALGSSTKSNSAFNSLRMYPKRSAELPALESDSEEEDINKNDNLNCAILNDSFIMSPGRSEQDESCASVSNAGTSSAVKSKKESTQHSFILLFDKIALESATKAPAKQLHHTPKNMQTTSSAELPQMMVTDTTKETPASSATCMSNQHTTELPTEPAHASRRKNIHTPFKATTVTSTTTTTNEGPATADAHFATPQIRSFSVQRPQRDLCSTQSQKTRSAIVNEFRSQKVLFQTPMAMSRAPMPCLSNDSITLSLCDTINEVDATPGTAEKSSSRTEKPLPTAGSKKSLERAFNEADTTKDNNDQAKIKPVEPNDNSATALTGKESVLHINNATYTLIKKLGCGGSSSVYSARRKDTNKEYALKVVNLQGDPAVVEGYMNETKLLAKLQGNVCVVALYDYQLLQKESKLYMVMEKGDSDLHKILQTYTTNLPLYVLANFLYQMLQAVNYIHQNGVIHSDLKPANFLMVNGRLKLIDFGIASNIALDSTSIIKFSQAGTFNYISPEALTDTSTGSSPMRNNQPKIKISTKSDVWSLGCILYLLLYKKTPYSHIKNIYAKISAISSPTHVIEYPGIPPYYPVMLVHMVKNCLQHNPKNRPSCAELLQYPFNMVIPLQNLTLSMK